MPRVTFGLCSIVLLSGLTVAFGQTPTPEATTENLLPADAQHALRSLIPAGKKLATINAYVAGTNVRDVNLGVSCSSNSSGSIEGNVDENGNVTAKSKSNGSSDCREMHHYYNTLTLGLPDPNDPNNSAYRVTAQCVMKWVWDHCGMPSQHTTYPIVLEVSKKGTFDIYAATEQRLGGKVKAARFAVLRVEHIRLKEKGAISPAPSP